MEHPQRRKAADRSFAILVGVAYLLAGLVWIAFSDQVGSVLFSSSKALTHFQTWKGVAFVATSATLVYLLAARSPGEPQPGARGLDVGLSALLAGLVLVTAAPLVALVGYNILRETRNAVADANGLAQDAATATSADMLALLEQRQRLAQLVAHRPLVTALDGGHCDPLLAEVPLLHEDVQNVLVLDAAGAVLCAAMPGGHHAVAASALKGRKHPLLTPPGPDTDAFALTVPVARTDGTPAGSVQLLLRAGPLTRPVAGNAADGVTTTLLTLEGKLLARSPPTPQPPGTRFPALARFAEAVRRGEDSVVAPGIDGIERFYALRRVGDWEVAVSSGVDMAGTYGPAKTDALHSLGVGLAVLLLAGLLISVIVRRIAGPMRTLAAAADAVAAGQFEQRAPEAGPREIAAVATQFNRMLDRLPALERELRESEERHRTLLDKLSRNLPGIIYQLCTPAMGRAYFPFVSEGVVHMFETTTDAARQDASVILNRVHRDDVAAVLAQVRSSAATRTRMTLGFRVWLHAGGVRHYLTYAQPEPLPDGATMWYGCAVDVTQLRNAQLALEQANEHLEARVAERTQELASANESLESFSYSIAHDLRAPLHAVEGFSVALPAAVDKQDAERSRRLVDRITANTAQMGRMIDGLLAIARAAKGTLDERPVDQQQLVARVLAELPRPADTQLECAALPTVRADAATLRQVWWNLLANAVKFSGERRPARIAIGHERRGGELVFWVRDNGAGFEPQYAGRLFTPFQRLHEATAFEGTGIGLALARRIVERHGGRMWAEGALEQGACFYFSLPAAREMKP